MKKNVNPLLCLGFFIGTFRISSVPIAANATDSNGLDSAIEEYNNLRDDTAIYIEEGMQITKVDLNRDLTINVDNIDENNVSDKSLVENAKNKKIVNSLNSSLVLNDDYDLCVFIPTGYTSAVVHWQVVSQAGRCSQKSVSYYVTSIQATKFVAEQRERPLEIAITGLVTMLLKYPWGGISIGLLIKDIVQANWANDIMYYSSKGLNVEITVSKNTTGKFYGAKEWPKTPGWNHIKVMNSKDEWVQNYSEYEFDINYENDVIDPDYFHFLFFC